MPRRRDHWSFKGMGSLWLVKISPERVHAGVIQKYSDTSVHLTPAGASADIRIAAHEIQWIRPLVRTEVDGWTVMLGFHPDETEFETWWIQGEAACRIGYCDPIGFAAGESWDCRADASVSPSATTRARGHILLHEELQRRRLEAASAGAHQQ